MLTVNRLTVNIPSPEGFYVVLNDVFEAQFWSTCRSDAMCQLAEQELFW